MLFISFLGIVDHEDLITHHPPKVPNICSYQARDEAQVQAQAYHMHI